MIDPKKLEDLAAKVDPAKLQNAVAAMREEAERISQRTQASSIYAAKMNGVAEGLRRAANRIEKLLPKSMWRRGRAGEE